MQSLINKCLDIIKDIWSLVVGLGITGRFFLSRRLTVHYPRAVVRREDSESFRGPIELVGSPKDPSIPRCISCMMCVTACPSGCISVTRQKAPKLTPEEEKALAEAEARGETVKRPAAPKNPAGWTYNYTYCSLCACCIESCPVKSIRFSNELYLAGTSRSDFHYDLLARLKRLAARNAAQQKNNPSKSEAGA
jgi:NADH-quinone oxidoreductase subunit I